MSTLSYDESSTGYAGSRAAESRAAVQGVRAPAGAGVVFLGVVWLIAAAFWAFSMMIDVGILQAVQQPTPNVQASADMGGIGWGLMTVVGVIVLGLALMYGLARYASRNRRNDPITEATTAALYDQAGDEPDGGTSISPNAQTPAERAINRGVQPPVD